MDRGRLPDLVKKDLLTPSVLNPALTEQVGQQSSHGVEASLALNLGKVRLNVNGTVLNARFDEFKATVGTAVISLAGNVPLNVPEQSANIMSFWDPTSAWQAHANLRYVGRRFADNTNVAASLIPSYTVLDLGTRWKATAASWPSICDSTTRWTRSTPTPGRPRRGCSARRDP